MIGCLLSHDGQFILLRKEREDRVMVAYNTGEETSLLVGFS